MIIQNDVKFGDKQVYLHPIPVFREITMFLESSSMKTKMHKVRRCHVVLFEFSSAWGQREDFQVANISARSAKHQSSDLQLVRHNKSREQGLQRNLDDGGIHLWGSWLIIYARARTYHFKNNHHQGRSTQLRPVFLYDNHNPSHHPLFTESESCHHLSLLISQYTHMGIMGIKRPLGIWYQALVYCLLYGGNRNQVSALEARNPQYSPSRFPIW
jgi:hypothetical protein